MTSRRTLALAGVVLLYAIAPLGVSDYWLAVLTLAGIAAIAALGLNVLTGVAGQLSLGHAAVVGVGAYTAASVGGPLPVWLAAALAAGALAGLATAPFALRLRGPSVAVATLAVVFVAQDAFRHLGGSGGRSDLPSPSLPGSHDQGWFLLVWALVGACTVVVANVVRSHHGRAMAALRSGEETARVTGVNVARTKVAAFLVAGALAGLAGGLLGAYRGHVGPDEWGVFLSVQYLAMVLLGGPGRVTGPIAGALVVVGLPRVVEQVVHAGTSGGLAGVTAAQVSQVLFGLAVIAAALVRARVVTAARPHQS